MKALFRFLWWPVLAGLLAALAILYTQPQLYRHGSRPAPPLPARSLSFADAVERAAPAVVNIYSRRVVHAATAAPLQPGTDGPHERVQQSLGSGVIVRADGYLLTNYHVIAGATDILVLLHDGRERRARLVGHDADTDLAVLHIDADHLTTMTAGNPAAARVGDIVLAIGNPWGFGHSVSQGIISATGRYGLQLQRFENFIQTDAAVNPGNSGGALIDAEGRLLGINTAIQSSGGGFEGIGLATPADTAFRVLDDIVQHGRVLRAWMGLQVQDLTPRLAQALGAPAEHGLLVNRVSPHSPAETAGIRTGDVILAVDGSAIVDGRQTMLDIAWRHPGEQVAMTLWRDGETLAISLALGSEPPASD